MSNRITKRELAQSLRAAGRTTEQIAATLEASILDVSTWLIPQSAAADRLWGRRVAYRAMLAALRALQDPEGHIWHGAGGECTGECRAVQEAVRLGEAGA